MLTFYLPCLFPATHLDALRSLQLYWFISTRDQPHPGHTLTDLDTQPGLLSRVETAFAVYDATWAAIAALANLTRLRVVLVTTSPDNPDADVTIGTLGSQHMKPVEAMRRAWLGPVVSRFKDRQGLVIFELGLAQSWITLFWSPICKTNQDKLRNRMTVKGSADEERFDEGFTLFAHDDML